MSEPIRSVIPGVPSSSGSRPSVIQLVFREKGALYAAYIPLFTEGGLFVPTTREYRLGEDISRAPITGLSLRHGRTQGVGVRFPNDDKTRLLKLKIEEILGTSISSSKPTQTI